MKEFTLNPLIRHEAHAFERIREADAAKLTKLALERWENEGGRIPEVSRVDRWPWPHAREFAVSWRAR